MVTKIKLLELMSSRMFHDLAGPIGAVHNSIEFLEEENQVIKDKALKIIQSSADEAIVRLKFFRQAYGTVGGDEVHLDVLVPLVEDFLASTKLKISWNINNNPVNYYLAKVILNLIIIAMGSLIHGGLIIVEQLDNGIKILLQGNNFMFSDETKHLLEGDLSNITLSSANIQIYYTYMMIEAADAKLSISKKAQELEFLVLYT